MLKTALPSRVRLLRKRMRLSQHALGVFCGVAASTINELESGFADPKLTTVIVVCRFLGVSPDALLGWEEFAGLHTVRSLTCNHCKRTPARGVPHSVGDCLREMYADGRSVRAIAIAHGLSERAVRVALEDDEGI